ncbi:MAG: M28 family peptidase [Candidatus Hodarchaeota archaeon]
MEKPSLDRIRATMKELHSIGHKIPGSSNERRASEYIIECLRGFGFNNIETMSFEIRGWNPKSCSIKILEPIEKEIEAALFPYSQTLKTTGKLTQISQIEEYATKNDGGTIGLSTWGPHLYSSPTRNYHKAIRRGLDSVLISTSYEGHLRKVVVVESGKLLKIPVISISKEDGDFLFSLMQKSPVELSIDVNVEIPSNAESMNIETILKGQDTSEQEIFVGTHFDSWFTGAADNCAPVAIFLELARLLQEYVQNGGVLKRRVRFLFFGAENGGTEGFYYWCNGSRIYLDKNHNAPDRVAAFLSLDSVGFPKPAQRFIGVTADLLQFAKDIESADTSIQDIDFYDPPGYGSDHWFFEISGIPTIYGVTFPSHLYQTQKDDLEHLDYEVVLLYAKFMHDALFKIANQDLLPIDIFTPLMRIEAILSKYSKMRASPFDMTRQLLRIRDIRTKKTLFNKKLKVISEGGDEKLMRDANRFLSSVAHLINTTIGWLWRITAPDDVDYLSRLELIEDYIALNAAIITLRGTPVGSLTPEYVNRYENQHDCAYNWIQLHKPLAELEKERSKTYKVIEKELEHISKILTTIENGIKELLVDKG